ncbi:Protein of unknown function [Pyronema omphalodes CBS 100304]|uniref:F-box domain-containing protein n=1 Tax=Pyronema omphalodes (strain CBS 100304) TaxID=1076935 RepID=U4LAP7_PYROM|nr:Protein of unknown function [Pyronema omphalodes CBS 100304]
MSLDAMPCELLLMIIQSLSDEAIRNHTHPYDIYAFRLVCKRFSKLAYSYLFRQFGLWPSSCRDIRPVQQFMRILNEEPTLAVYTESVAVVWPHTPQVQCLDPSIIGIGDSSGSGGGRGSGSGSVSMNGPLPARLDIRTSSEIALDTSIWEASLSLLPQPYPRLTTQLNGAYVPISTPLYNSLALTLLLPKFTNLKSLCIKPHPAILDPDLLFTATEYMVLNTRFPQLEYLEWDEGAKIEFCFHILLTAPKLRVFKGDFWRGSSELHEIASDLEPWETAYWTGLKSNVEEIHLTNSWMPAEYIPWLLSRTPRLTTFTYNYTHRSIPWDIASLNQGLRIVTNTLENLTILPDYENITPAFTGTHVLCPFVDFPRLKALATDLCWMIHPNYLFERQLDKILPRGLNYLELQNVFPSSSPEMLLRRVTRYVESLDLEQELLVRLWDTNQVGIAGIMYGDEQLLEYMQRLRRVVERREGRVRVERLPGGGTYFLS